MSRTTRPRVLLAGLLVLVALVGAAPAGGITPGGVSTATDQTLLFSLPKAQGAEVGDLLLATLSFEGGSSTSITPPAGWSLALRSDNGPSMGTATYWRIATLGEPGSYLWTFGAPTGVLGGMLAYAGVVSNDPFIGTADLTGSGTTMTAPSLEATRVGAYHVALFAGFLTIATSTPTLTTDALMFERYNVGAGAGAAAALERERTETGPTGTIATEMSAGGAWAAQSLMLRPVVASFVAATGTGPELVSQPGIAVRLNGPAGHDVTIPYSVIGGTAVEGVHFLAGPGAVTVPAGSLTATLPIQIVDNVEVNPDRTFELLLGTPPKALLTAPITHNFTILNDDLVGPSPEVTVTIVSGSGGAPATPGWGGWTAQPGAVAVTSVSYLKVANTGQTTGVQVVIDFTEAAFIGALDETASVPIDDNLRFAVALTDSEDTTPPSGQSFTWNNVAPAGSHTLTLPDVGSVAYVLYRIVALPDPLAAQEYRAAFTVTEL